MANRYERQIQELIDSFPDDRYEELLEVMVDSAQTALEAKREETRAEGEDADDEESD